MPLAERVIGPSNLGGHPINLRESEDGTVHHSVATNCLIGALYQLASLVRQADDIFCDITDECQKVLDRTQNINKKIDHINYHVQNLDAKNVKIRKYFFCLHSIIFLAFLWVFFRIILYPIILIFKVFDIPKSEMRKYLIKLKIIDKRNLKHFCEY